MPRNVGTLLLPTSGPARLAAAPPTVDRRAENFEMENFEMENFEMENFEM